MWACASGPVTSPTAVPVILLLITCSTRVNGRIRQRLRGRRGRDGGRAQLCSPYTGLMTLVLLSGGLDSAVLLAHEAQRGRPHPLYVSMGLSWERSELRMLEHLLASPAFRASTAPLCCVDLSMRDVYSESHWAFRGLAPSADTPDEQVFLQGRNLALLTKAGVIAAQRGLRDISLGLLRGNPFPDARSSFLHAMGQAISLGLNHSVEVRAPFAHLRKEEVIRLGTSLGVPLDRTLSCMRPQPSSSRANALPAGCGACSKCRERADAFAAAGVVDGAARRLALDADRSVSGPNA